MDELERARLATENAIKQVDEKMDDLTTSAVANISTIGSRFRPLRRRSLRGIFSRETIYEMMDELDRRREDRRFRRNERQADIERGKIFKLQQKVDLIKQKMETSNPIMRETYRKQVENIENAINNRKEDLNDFERKIVDARRTRETMDEVMRHDVETEEDRKRRERESVMGALANADRRLEERRNTENNGMNNIPGLSINDSNANNNQVNSNPDLNDPNYLKMIAARGEGLGQYRQRYKILKRNDKRYRLHQIATGTITALGVAGMMWAIEKMNPGYLSINSTLSQDMQSLVETGKNIVERVMSDPSFANVCQILKEGSGVFGFSTVVSAIYGGRFVRTNRARVANQYEIETMEEENYLNIKDDTERIARGMGK